MTDIKEIKLKKWNTRKIVATGIVGGLAAAAVVAFFPEYGVYNRWDKRRDIEKIGEEYVHIVDSLEATTDSLGSKLAERDSMMEGTIDNYNRQLGDLSKEHQREREREREKLAREYERKIEEARKASLDTVMARYPRFNPSLDYFADDGNFGGRVRAGAKDIEDYFALESRLDIMLKGVEDASEIKDRILSGKTTLRVMTEKEASRYNPVVVMDPGYWAFEFESGKAVGLGRKLNNYPLGVNQNE